MIFSNKRGMEIAISTIVIIIISVVIFSMSLYFVFKWFGQAEELKAEIDKQTKEQITTALKSGNQLVAIPFSIQETKRGNPITFGAGVRYIGPDTEKQFSTATSFSGAYTPDGKTICAQTDQCAQHIQQTWLGNFAITPTFTLKKNEEKLIPILIRVDSNIASGRQTPIGDYIFNLCVYDKPLDINGQPFAECTTGQYKNSPDAFYTNKIYQLVIKVI